MVALSKAMQNELSAVVCNPRNGNVDAFASGYTFALEIEFDCDKRRDRIPSDWDLLSSSDSDSYDV